MSQSTSAKAYVFSREQVFAVAIISFLQFTIILDFMILSPLGAILLEALHITTSQFGLAVSAYAIAAGLSGFLAAGFADRFDRKRLLLFFYTGFVLGTLVCGVAPNYAVLLAGRIVTGLFGGVIGAISFAILTDLFPLHVRGRVMGYVQSSFAASQVLGIPLGIFLATHLGWHAPFLLIAGVALVVGVVILLRMRPVDAHLAHASGKSPLLHLWHTATRRRYQAGFAATTLLTTGGFMLMPFGSAFTVNNLGIALTALPVIYMITGVSSLGTGPLMGRISDRFGKYRTFCYATVAAAAITLFYTRLGPTPIWEIIVINVVLFAAISARMISAGALNSAMPEPADRGAYMAINASLQQIAGGIASLAAGAVVVQHADGHLDHYPVLGYIVTGTMLASMLLLARVDRLVNPPGGSAAAQ
ncbi:MFS transporter [Opitutus sp. ER46]|uniref:MFS transporter n=1 Tax=Opitutus sp. ER46 TaxID=2161864 RepID=UPI000D2F6E66|nr:MFS transporter [Opitutus sp. ER46]PTX96613.1 MFS transporter [Opitutus sp. ER46]